MAEKFIKVINGLPVAVSSYDESIYYDSGLAAETSITLPNSGYFSDADAKDLLVILNDRVVEAVRDFNVVGVSAPYTQIEFIYDLSNDSVVRFKTNI